MFRQALRIFPMMFKSERCDFFPDACEPTFALIVRDGAGRNIFDRGVSNVVAVERVVGSDVFRANNATQHSFLSLSRKRRGAAAFENKISVGQYIHDSHRDLGRDFFRVADLAAAVEVLFRAEVQRRKVSALGQKPAGSRAVKKLGDARVHTGTLRRLRGVILGRRVVLLDENGHDVADGSRAFVRDNGVGGIRFPKRLSRDGKRRCQQRGEQGTPQHTKGLGSGVWGLGFSQDARPKTQDAIMIIV